MRRLLSAFALAGLASQAPAADLPVLQPPSAYVPAYPVYFRWEGFYVGGQVTGGDSNSDFSHATQAPIAFSLRELALEVQGQPSTWPVLGQGDSRAVGFGAYTGYNLQFDNAIIGWDLSYTRSSFSLFAPSSPLERVLVVNGYTYDTTVSATGSINVQDFATLRARLGWAIDNYMPYATLGLAAGRADITLTTDVRGTQTGPNPSPPPATLTIPFDFPTTISKNSTFLFGYAGGGGLEVAFTPHLTGRIEYEYIQWAPVFQISSHLHMARLGLGYKF
jgi:opacity protein-like surface antigen